jgi:hypothetical protein
VLGSFDPDESLRFDCGFDDLFYLTAGTVGVVISTDEKLWLGASREKTVGVVSAIGVDREAKADQRFDTRVAATGAQTDVGAKRKACEEDGLVQIVFEPVERGANVVLLATAFIEDALAKAYATKVEAEHREPERGKDLHGVVDDLVVHRAAAEWMWVADERGVRGIVAACVQNGFESACRTVKVINRS